jgi:hypothetical protein
LSFRAKVDTLASSSEWNAHNTGSPASVRGLTISIVESLKPWPSTPAPEKELKEAFTIMKKK